MYYGHSDHLGSIKLGSTPTRTMSFDLAYAPFGETYATSGTTDPAFTGQRQDTVAGLYDFPDRSYSTQGRWPHPDPSGLASVHLNDPQTLNRYAYVRNNPLALVDPNGLGDQGCEEDICIPVEEIGADGGWPSGDPTSGGDPNNSGDDVCGIGNLCTNSSGDLITTMDYNDLSVVVSASLSDGTQPVIETESANISTVLQEECGGCLLGQMQNDAEAMATLSGANTLVEIAGYTEIAGVGIVVAPEAGAFLVDNWIKLTAITALTTFTTESIASVAGLESNGPATGPHAEIPNPNIGDPRRDPGSIDGDPPVEPWEVP